MIDARPGENDEAASICAFVSRFISAQTLVVPIETQWSDGPRADFGSTKCTVV